MPAIDADTDELILRIAYDGASRAGKTTNLRQLSERLDSQIAAPVQSGERTVYFDWMRYRGGSFEGRPIRCELLSAPGQELLSRRRDILLSTADAIVIVLDSSQIDLEALAHRIQELRSKSSARTPPAVLVQANKCDLAPSLPLEELRNFCREHQPPVMLQTATSKNGEGVRETFVIAVRLAVVRAHALRRQGFEFPTASTMDAANMLKWLRAQESLQRSRLSSIPAQIGVQDTETLAPIQGVLYLNPKRPHNESEAEQAPRSSRPKKSAPPSEHPSRGEDSTPELPRPNVPEGMVWPPVTGRAALQDIAQHGVPVQKVDESGAYFACVQDSWEIHSAADARYESPVVGMEHFLDWAQKHTELAEILSGPRCIVLAPENSLPPSDRGQVWRLWQIVRTHRPVRDRIAALLDEENPRIIAASLLSAGACLLDLESQRERFPLLPESSLDGVGERLNGSHYVGMLPAPGDMKELPSQKGPSPRTLLSRELAKVILEDWRENRGRILREIRNLSRASKNPHEKLAGEALSKILDDHSGPAGVIRLWSRSLRIARR